MSTRVRADSRVNDPAAFFAARPSRSTGSKPSYGSGVFSSVIAVFLSVEWLGSVSLAYCGSLVRSGSLFDYGSV
jgi:hypothetical protein